MSVDADSCGVCGRPRADHGRPVRLTDGTQIVPACELVHPGGARWRPVADLVLASVASVRAEALAMTVDEAKEIAGTLGATTKMPGRTYGLDAFKCQVGSVLADQPGSVCYGCYARKGFYTWPYPRLARAIREGSIERDRWPLAMVRLIIAYCEDDGVPWFRWHDSGDLRHADHLFAIAVVAAATPRVRHWLPTRETEHVAEYLDRGGRIPPNLTIRISAHWIGAPPELRLDAVAGLPTSTVHREQGKPVQVSDRRRDSIECRAYTRDNQCGPCRACWSSKVINVSYREH